MSSIIRATTTSGLQIAPDNSGSLQLQTNGTTTALTIDTSQNVGIGTTTTTPTNGRALIIYETTYPRLTLRNSTTGQTSTDGYGLVGVGNDLYVENAEAGNLAFTTSNTERMRIDSSGNVGIGISAEARFTVGGSITGATNSTIARIGNIDYTTNTVLSVAPGVVNFDAPGVVGGRFHISSGGEVRVGGTADQGAYNLQCNGTGVWGAGAYVNGSDERIKENVAPLDSGLDVVAKLNPVTYKYKEDWSKDQSTQTGFIAQELLTALEGKNYVDGVVQQGGEYMSVAYQNIIPILTKAIQEQQTIINDLKARIETLEAK